MFTHHPMILKLLELVQTDYGVRLPIEAIHGAPPVPWNAGRVMQRPVNQNSLANAMRLVEAAGIGYFPTFTNHLLEDGDLGNPTCNFILETIAAKPDLNGVIVVSDKLSDYIHRRYPNLRQVASVIKATLEGGLRKPQYYNELGNRFYRYVVDPDDSRDLKLMDQLDRDKAEIMLNESCVAFCPDRARHYQAYARLQRAIGTPDQQAAQAEADRIRASCRSPMSVNLAGHNERSCNMERSEVKALYDMGFRHFKLQGRLDDPFTFSYDLVRFLLEPDIAAPRTQKMLSGWLMSVLVMTGKR